MVPLTVPAQTSHFEKSSSKLKGIIMNLLLKIFIPLSAAWSLSIEAASLVDELEIRRRLCAKAVCESHWNQVTLLSCNDNSRYEPGKDSVFGSYIVSGYSCLCPCNFPKFYK